MVYAHWYKKVIVVGLISCVTSVQASWFGDWVASPVARLYSWVAASSSQEVSQAQVATTVAGTSLFSGIACWFVGSWWYKKPADVKQQNSNPDVLPKNNATSMPTATNTSVLHPDPKLKVFPVAAFSGANKFEAIARRVENLKKNPKEKEQKKREGSAAEFFFGDSNTAVEEKEALKNDVTRLEDHVRSVEQQNKALTEQQSESQEEFQAAIGKQVKKMVELEEHAEAVKNKAQECRQQCAEVKKRHAEDKQRIAQELTKTFVMLADFQQKAVPLIAQASVAYVDENSDFKTAVQQSRVIIQQAQKFLAAIPMASSEIIGTNYQMLTENIAKHAHKVSAQVLLLEKIQETINCMAPTVADFEQKISNSEKKAQKSFSTIFDGFGFSNWKLIMPDHAAVMAKINALPETEYTRQLDYLVRNPVGYKQLYYYYLAKGLTSTKLPLLLGKSHNQSFGDQLLTETKPALQGIAKQLADWQQLCVDVVEPEKLMARQNNLEQELKKIETLDEQASQKTVSLKQQQCTAIERKLGFIQLALNGRVTKTRSLDDSMTSAEIYQKSLPNVPLYAWNDDVYVPVMSKNMLLQKNLSNVATRLQERHDAKDWTSIDMTQSMVAQQ